MFPMVANEPYDFSCRVACLGTQLQPYIFAVTPLPLVSFLVMNCIDCTCQNISLPLEGRVNRAFMSVTSAKSTLSGTRYECLVSQN